MKKFYFLIVSLIFYSNSFSQTKFAVIGDYGKANVNELNVSNLVKSWNPEFIITLGDNNYELGEASTIDTNIGKYYSQFIYPYTGIYGTGDTVNRFFPSMGNHDWYTSAASAYLNYFTLPGNERYYDFVRGSVHFFAIDSDPNEPHGVDSNSVQALWLKLKLSQSPEEFKIVYFHHPPYSSSAHGSSLYMRWPFKRWGATAVLTGHDHSYERIFNDSMFYIVNGLGGRSIYEFYTIVSGSQFRYNANYGAMLAYSYNDSIVFRFYNISGDMIDHFKILSSVKRLQLTSLIQGFYKTETNSLISDTVKVLIRNNSSPYEIKDSACGYPDTSGNAEFDFSHLNNATNYFLVLKHRNSIETWSSAGNKFINNALSYNFTSSASSSYGNNLVLKGSRYCVYGGDVDQDGIVDASDLSIVKNDASGGLEGYISSDVTGDEYTDAEDISLVENNVSRGTVSVIP